MKIYAIVSNDYENNAQGYVTSEEEAIQLCLDGENYYRELNKIEVMKETMSKQRFSLVEICFRLQNGIWNPNDVRIYHSDKPYQKAKHSHNIYMDWICLQMIPSNRYDVDETISRLQNEFEFLKNRISGLDVNESREVLETVFGIKRV